MLETTVFQNVKGGAVTAIVLNADMLTLIHSIP